MKKYIFGTLLAAFAALGMSSCKAEYGTAEGGDAAPKATLHQYTITADDGDSFDGDNDIRLRISCNKQTETVYYLAELTETRNLYIANNGEQGYADYVIKNGKSVSNPGEGVDVYITGMKGANTITAVAVKGDTKVLTTTEFYGIIWETVAQGRMYARFLDGTSANTTGPLCELQQRADIPTSYRIKNAFAVGMHLPINIISDKMDDDGIGYMPGVPCWNVEMPKTAMNAEYGDYGTVSLADYYTYSGDESYIPNCLMYEDGNMLIYSAYTVSAGRITSGYVYFDVE